LVFSGIGGSHSLCLEPRVRVYLDHNATTPLLPEVIDAMAGAMQETWGNPSSVHGPGRRARAAVDVARRSVARLIGSGEREVVFTGGGSEADNLALRGAFEAGVRAGRGKVIISAVEHPGVLRCVEDLEQRRGAEVVRIGVDHAGRLDRAALAAALDERTAIVSIMHTNNETGVRFPVAEFAESVHRAGALFHVDAVQAIGREPLDVGALGADLVALSAHKICGPKGVGALYVKRGTAIDAVILGGQQERGLRAGTENVVGIVGFGVAAEHALLAASDFAERVGALRDRLERGLLQLSPGASVNGDTAHRCPAVSNITFPGVEGEAILLSLDMVGISASSGSACASGSLEPSHVLLAMGCGSEHAHASVRFSLGRHTMVEEIDYVLAQLPPMIDRLRELAPDMAADELG
jgi:cysteine desulfurase